jgi:phosphate transport system ATP-binding protein
MWGVGLSRVTSSIRDISQGGRTGYLVELGETAQIFEAPREQLTKEYVRGEFS